MYVINGKFLTRPMNGQIRVAIEIVKELDKLVGKDEIEIVAPKSPYTVEGLKNIRIKRIGRGNPHIWEQTVFWVYVCRKKRIGINILNSHPILKPDVCYIHDVLFKAYPYLQDRIYGKLSSAWNRMMFYSATCKAISIITVSQFSKKEIGKYYPASMSKIHVIYNGWQHMQRIKEDNSIFIRYPQIKKRNYCLAVSGITPQKNFTWILKNAQYNKNKMYVIVGKYERTSQLNLSEGGQENILYTGRLSDGEMKALMKECWLFIHPAIYEGFGMTPLEAIAAGARNVAVSSASCLPEIYRQAVSYIDPYNPCVDLNTLINHVAIDPQTILDLYSWEMAAKKLYKIIL